MPPQATQSGANVPKAQIPIPPEFEAMVKRAETGDRFAGLRGHKFMLPIIPPKETVDIGFTINTTASKYRTAVRESNAQTAQDALHLMALAHQAIVEYEKGDFSG